MSVLFACLGLAASACNLQGMNAASTQQLVPPTSPPPATPPKDPAKDPPIDPTIPPPPPPAPGSNNTAVDGSLASSGILNPYFSNRSWKIWSLDTSPVTVQVTVGSTLVSRTYSPVAENLRKIPDPNLVTSFPGTFLGFANVFPSTTTSGFWDDGYATLDGAHSTLGDSWTNGSNSVSGLASTLAANFSEASSVSSQPDANTRRSMGVNFTSQSQAGFGHQAINYQLSYINNGMIEKDFLFSNIVRGGPAYRSFEETVEDRVADNYDALFSHSLQSVGRSWSELGALQKMEIAGAYLPRATKNLLKNHGAYAATLLQIWRASLPYVNADGTDLSFGNELRHRVAYLSDGGNLSSEFATYNLYYHRYENARHLFNMVKMAKAMTVAPPVAVLKIAGISVVKNGATLVNDAATDARIKTNAKTIIRVSPNDDEEVTLRIDLGSSYDLQGRPLSYSLFNVYQNLNSVTIAQEGASNIYKITVRHNHSLPRHRISVGVVANNGAQLSLPVFVNFFYYGSSWVDPGYNKYFNPVKTDTSSWGYTNAVAAEINKNERPVFTTSLGASAAVTVARGATASFTLNCSDPEGFTTRYYRWSGEMGTLTGNNYVWSIPAVTVAGTYPLHFICSDQTGGYNSLQVNVQVQ